MGVACRGEDGLEAPLLLGRRRRRGPSLPAHPGAGVPAARLQDAPLHQPLGCADNRGAPGGQQDSEQIRIRQYRTGNASHNYFLAGTAAAAALRRRGRENDEGKGRAAPRPLPEHGPAAGPAAAAGRSAEPPRLPAAGPGR